MLESIESRQRAVGPDLYRRERRGFRLCQYQSAGQKRQKARGTRESGERGLQLLAGPHRDIDLGVGRLGARRLDSDYSPSEILHSWKNGHNRYTSTPR